MELAENQVPFILVLMKPFNYDIYMEKCTLIIFISPVISSYIWRKQY